MHIDHVLAQLGWLKEQGCTEVVLDDNNVFDDLKDIQRSEWQPHIAVVVPAKTGLVL